MLIGLSAPLLFVVSSALQSSAADSLARSEIDALNFLTMRIHEMRATGDVDRICRRLVHGVDSAAIPAIARRHWDDLFKISNECIAQLEEAGWNEGKIAEARRASADAALTKQFVGGAGALLTGGALLPALLAGGLGASTSSSHAEAQYARTSAGVLTKLREKLADCAKAIEVDKNQLAKGDELKSRCIDEEECNELFRISAKFATTDPSAAKSDLRRYLRATPSDPRAHYLMALLSDDPKAREEFRAVVAETPDFVRRDEVVADACVRLAHLHSEAQWRGEEKVAPSEIGTWLARGERYALQLDSSPIELEIGVLSDDSGLIRELVPELLARPPSGVDAFTSLWIVRALVAVEKERTALVPQVLRIIEDRLARRGELEERGRVAGNAPPKSDERFEPDALDQLLSADPRLKDLASMPEVRAAFPRAVMLRLRSIRLAREEFLDPGESGSAPELFVAVLVDGRRLWDSRRLLVQDRFEVRFDVPLPWVELLLHPGEMLEVQMLDADAFADDTLLGWRVSVEGLLRGEKLDPSPRGSGVEYECEVR